MKNKQNLFFFILQSVSSVVYPIVTFPYASKILGPEGIGTANFVDSLCKYFMLFAALGIPIYGVREIARSLEKEQKNQVFSEIILINLISTSVCLIAYFCLIFFNDKFSQQSGLYTLGGFYILLNTFSIEWYFNGIGEFKFVAIRGIVVRLLSIAGLLLLVRDQQDIYWYFFLNVLSLGINNAINITFALKKSKFILKALKLRRHLKPLFYIFSSTVAISIYILVDTIILGFLKSYKDVGYYSFASKLNKIPLSIVLAYGTIIIPQLSKLIAEGNVELFRSFIKKSFEYVIILSIPISYFLFVNAFEIIILFSNSEFAPAIYSVKIMSILCLIIGLSNIFGLQILTPIGKEKEFLYCVSAGMIVSLMMNFLLIPYLSDIGASLANIISEITVTATTFYFSNKYLKITFPVSFTLKHFFWYFPIAIISYFFNQLLDNNILKVAASITFFGIWFFLINIFLMPNVAFKEAFGNILHKISRNKNEI